MAGRDLPEYEIVYLAEKSSQVAALSEVLEANEVGGKWDPAYNTEKKIAIVPLRGHVLTAKEPNEYANPDYSSWDENGVFVFPERYELKPSPGSENLLKTAVAHLKKAKKIILATDYDNEGATLGMNVIKWAGSENKVERMLEMGSLHPVELKKTIENPTDIPYLNMFAAGSTRAFIDWAEGMTYSRALSYYLGNKWEVRMNFGGVLTPIIYIVIEREIAFDQHQVSYYWHVIGEINSDGQKFPFQLKHKTTDDKGKEIYSEVFDSEQEATEAINKILDKTIEIESISRQSKRTTPPQLFEFSSLKSHMASKAFKIQTTATGESAQKLYDELKLETYARTDVPYLKESEFQDVEPILKKLGDTNVIDKEIIRDILSGEIPKRKGKGNTFYDKEVISHGAIVPTLGGDTGRLYPNLSKVDKLVFTEVAKRYTANFMQDYEYELVSGNSTDIDGVKLFFSERVPKKAGWKKIYEPDIEDDISGYIPEIPLSLKAGDTCSIEDTKFRKIETKPKPLFTRATLEDAIAKIAKLYPDNEDIKKYLGDVGIGTVATRTDIIDKALKEDKHGREAWLIEDAKGKLRGSKTAKKLISILYQDLVSPVKRALLSKKLKQIEHGDTDAETVINEMKKEVLENVHKIKQIFEEKGPIAVGALGRQAESLGTCPVCGKGNIIEKKKIYACSEAKYIKNEDGSIHNEGCPYMIRKAGLSKLGKNNISKTEVQRLFKNGNVTVSLKSQKTGKGYNAKMVVDEKWGVKIDFDNNKRN